MRGLTIMLLSAVITHFFPSREPNLPIIAQALRSQSLEPDEVLLWNNDRPLDMAPAGFAVIQSPYNVGCQARFLAGLMARGEWILFQDNDIALRPKAIANLIEWAAKADYPAIWALDGRRGLSRGYARSVFLAAEDVKGKPIRVDMTMGHAEIVRRSDLIRIMAGFPFGPSGRMDDLQLAGAAELAGVRRYVVPAARSEYLDHLSSRGHGAEYEPDHYIVREALARRLFARRA